MVGFRITVVDDRTEFANAERFPEADVTIAADYGTAFRRLNISSSTFIVIVTRAHQSDEQILEQAVATPARYIGMIGSMRKVRTTFEHLRARGISRDSLGRVHAPVGLEIGAVTPEEIAASIVAELINTRRRGPGSETH